MKATVAFSENDGQIKEEVKETIPLTITSKKIGIALTSKCKICMIKTLRPKKEIEDISRWKDLPCLWVSRINIGKMAVRSKGTYRFSATPIKIPTQFFSDLESTVFRSLWKHKRPKLA